MNTLRTTRLVVLALVAFAGSTGLTWATDSSCPDGFVSIDSNGFSNKVGLSTKGENEYVAVDQFGNGQIIKGKLQGDCIALISGQYGGGNLANFHIVGDYTAVALIQNGGSIANVHINGTATVGGNLAPGTVLDLNIEGSAEVMINQG